MPFGEIPLAVVHSKFRKANPPRYIRAGIFTDSNVAVTHSLSVLVKPLEDYSYGDPYVAGVQLVPLDVAGTDMYFRVSTQGL
jgi:hypothetical protein